jgi:hypothetical protein
LIGDLDPLNCINKPLDLGVSYYDWYNNTGATTIAFDLSKSPLLANSGTSVNNSRSVLLEIQSGNFGAGAGAVELVIHCFYTSVVNSSIENNIVDS